MQVERTTGVGRRFNETAYYTTTAAAVVTTVAAVIGNYRDY